MKKLLIIILAYNLTYGNSLDINTNDDTLDIGIQWLANDYLQLNSANDYIATLGYLSSKNQSYAQTNQKLMSAGVKVVSPYADDYGVVLGLGLQAVVVDNSKNSFGAIPIVVYFKYIFDDDISFNGSFVYAPETLSFWDAKTYKATTLKANYQIVDDSFLYTGLRNIETKYIQGDTIKYDDSVFFGCKILF